MTDYRGQRDRREDFLFTSERDRLKPVMEEKEELVIRKEKKCQTISKLRIRKSPNGEVVRIEEKNSILKYTEIKDGWAHLTDGNYCMAQYLNINI